MAKKSKLAQVRDQRAYVELCRCEVEDTQRRAKAAEAKRTQAALALATAELQLAALEGEAPGDGGAE